MPNRALVLDANILIRAVLGTRVRRLLETYAEGASCLVPEMAYLEAEEHLPALFEKREDDPAKGLDMLRAIGGLIDLVGKDVYNQFQVEALRRIGVRDSDDWPILACALAFSCPIWTEDTDFFGCGVATWTSNRVEIFLSD